MNLPAIKPLIIAGPSGVGKGTLIRRARQAFPEAFSYSVSHTTRERRPTESHGSQYFFVKREEFERMIRENAFLEYALINGNYYGTSVIELNRISIAGKIALLELDLQGIKQILQTELGKNSNLVFICPPSIDALVSRLKSRGTESDEEIQERINLAKCELEEAKRLAFDFLLINDDLEIAYFSLIKFILSSYNQLLAQTLVP